MLRIAHAILLAFLAAAALTQCQRVPSGGGIVDNGRTPDGIGTETPGDGTPTTEPGGEEYPFFRAQLYILDAYAVDVLRAGWWGETSDEVTKLFNEQTPEPVSITFQRTAPAEAEIAPAAVNEHGVGITVLSETQTLLVVDETTHVWVGHSPRTVEIDAILNSFRKRVE